MTYPYITTITAGVVLLMQIILAITVSAARGKYDTSVGDGGKDEMLRAVRRHGNLAENAAIFLLGFALLELSELNTWHLIGLSVAFVIIRVLHAVGLSRANTNNVLRLLGGAGTYLVGLVLGGTLIWIGVNLAIHGGMQ